MTATAARSSGSRARRKAQFQRRGFPTLFEGTVTSFKGSSVTFRVDSWLNGGDADTVVLDSDTGRPETLTFVDGEHYIVAADKDGVVPQCGANPASAGTTNQFRRAYGK